MVQSFSEGNAKNGTTSGGDKRLFHENKIKKTKQSKARFEMSEKLEHEYFLRFKKNKNKNENNTVTLTNCNDNCIC